MNLDNQIERAKVLCYIDIDVNCIKANYHLNKKYNLNDPLKSLKNETVNAIINNIKLIIK